MTLIKFGCYNHKRGGWDRHLRCHKFGPMLATLDRAPLPDVLALSEATLYADDDQRPLWRVVRDLNSMRDKGTGSYYPFLAQRPGSRNHPLLLVAGDVVPKSWVTPGPNTRAVHEWTALVLINGIVYRIQGVHWNGGGGSDLLRAQAHTTAQLAAEPGVLLGDFNGTSSAPGEYVPEDWHDRMAATPWKRAQKGRLCEADGRYYVDTYPIDYLRQSGFLDAGEQAGDLTVTVNDHADGGSGLRIDRIMWSLATAATLVPGSYRVHVPPPGDTSSDHRYVTATLAFN